MKNDTLSTHQNLKKQNGAAQLDATVGQHMPDHKRFLYRHTGNTQLQIGLTTRDGMRAAITARKTEVSEKGRKCETEEDFFEATFHTASEFVAWIDSEWRNE